MFIYKKLVDHLGIFVDISYDTAMSIDGSSWKDLLYKNKVLVFKDWQGLSPEQLCDFSKKFGSPWTKEMYDYTRENSVLGQNNISYTHYNNKAYSRLSADIPWHSDIANEPNFKKYPIRMLYCIGLPSHFDGNSTNISNLAKAYSELSDQEKEYFENVTFTYQSWQYPGTNIVDYSAVEVHPYTKEKFLRFNVVSKDKGWIRNGYYKNPEGKITELINKDLYALIKETADKYEYVHNWNVGDLVIFDNWATIHKKGSGTIYEDSIGFREFIRLTIDNDF